MLAVDTLSALIFNSSNSSQFLLQLNQQLNSLIENDNSLLEENANSPGIWENKWLNDSSIEGYAKGKAVWLNTQSPYSILNSRYDQVVQYVLGNKILKAMFYRIDQTDQSKINEFLLKAIVGTASPNVPPIYYLGDMSKMVQIKVSKIDNNKYLPSSSYWYDFYRRSTKSANTSAMLSCLSLELSSALSIHEERFHLSSLSEDYLASMGFFKKTPFEVSSVQTQHFYDHTYCDSMKGFDYAVSWVVDGSRWCRTWKSGYIEQGGFVNNTHDALVNVSFLSSYDYPIGSNFYQTGYNKLAGINEQNCYGVYGQIADGNRYVFTVTPILNAQLSSAYASSPIESDGTKLYACTDATNITNSGFSIVNTDRSMSKYSKYSWHAAGYAIM